MLEPLQLSGGGGDDSGALAAAAPLLAAQDPRVQANANGHMPYQVGGFEGAGRRREGDGHMPYQVGLRERGGRTVRQVATAQDGSACWNWVPHATPRPQLHRVQPTTPTHPPTHR